MKKYKHIKTTQFVYHINFSHDMNFNVQIQIKLHGNIYFLGCLINFWYRIIDKIPFYEISIEFENKYFHI